jgi:hypothetical protein
MVFLIKLLAIAIRTGCGETGKRLASGCETV